MTCPLDHRVHRDRRGGTVGATRAAHRVGQRLGTGVRVEGVTANTRAAPGSSRWAASKGLWALVAAEGSIPTRCRCSWLPVHRHRRAGTVGATVRVGVGIS